jgi:hypothetical protein
MTKERAASWSLRSGRCHAAGPCGGLRYIFH